MKYRILFLAATLLLLPAPTQAAALLDLRGDIFSPGNNSLNELHAPPASLNGITLNVSHAGGATSSHAEFGKLTLGNQGFISNDGSSVASAAGQAQAYMQDSLTLNSTILDGQTGSVVFRVRLTGPMLDRTFSSSGYAPYDSQLSFSFGTISGGSVGYNAIGPGLIGNGLNISGTLLDQVLTSSHHAFTFGNAFDINMSLANYAEFGGSLGSPGAGTYNLGTTTLQWLGIDVFDDDLNLVTNYTASSDSGFLYSAPEPSIPALLGIAGCMLAAQRRRRKVADSEHKQH